MFIVIEVALGCAAAVLAVAAILWIRRTPGDDPALDRLLMVVSPLLWIVRRTRGPRS
jgi:hypothetical protein